MPARRNPHESRAHPSLARYFPSQDLVVYVEFDGLDGHSEAWKKTAAYRLFTETTTGAMYEATLPGLFELLLARQNTVRSMGAS